MKNLKRKSLIFHLKELEKRTTHVPIYEEGDDYSMDSYYYNSYQEITEAYALESKDEVLTWKNIEAIYQGAFQLSRSVSIFRAIALIPGFNIMMSDFKAKQIERALCDRLGYKSVSFLYTRNMTLKDAIERFEDMP